MSDLISRSALLKKKTRMTEYDETGCGVHVYVVRAEDVEAAPSVDAEPVQHGRRERPCINKYGHPCHHCSECGFKASQKDRNYCPNCGAKMDAEVEGDD